MITISIEEEGYSIFNQIVNYTFATSIGIGVSGAALFAGSDAMQSDLAYEVLNVLPGVGDSAKEIEPPTRYLAVGLLGSYVSLQPSFWFWALAVPTVGSFSSKLSSSGLEGKLSKQK